MWRFLLVLISNSFVQCSQILDYSVTLNGQTNCFTDESEPTAVNAEKTYNFLNGEEVLITCQRSQKCLTGALLTNISPAAFDYLSFSNRSIRYNTTTINYHQIYMKLTQNSNNKYIDCTLTRFWGEICKRTRIFFKIRDNKLAPMPSKAVATLKKCFVSDEQSIQNYKEATNCKMPGNNPYIKGLQWEKTLAIYYIDTKTKVIVYAYNVVGEILNLQCIADSPIWSNTTDAVTKTEMGTSVKFEINTALGDQIACTSNKSMTIVILKFVPYKDISRTNPTSTGSTEATNVQTVEKTDSNRQNEENDDQQTDKTGISSKPNSKEETNTLAVIVCCVVMLVLIFIVVIVCFIKRIKEKPKPKNVDVNINYETLPEHNQGTMPVPKQWKEAQYGVPRDQTPITSDYAVPYKPSLEEMYAKPTPKNQRSTTDDESVSYASTDLLATTANKSNKPYSNMIKVLPTENKTLAYAKMGKSQTAANPESPYAEVGGAGSDTASESPYAEVSFNNVTYAEPNAKPRYDNVFDSQRYVNTNSRDDYVEPDYCAP